MNGYLANLITHDGDDPPSLTIIPIKTARRSLLDDMKERYHE